MVILYNFEFSETFPTRSDYSWTTKSAPGNIVHARHAHHADTGAPWWNLGDLQTFCSAHRSSWGFACTKFWFHWQLEKYSWRKRLFCFIRKLNFSNEMLYIFCGPLANQHARCHKESYSPRGRAVSTNNLRLQWQAETRSGRWTVNQVTRRDGSASWRVIFVETVCLLEG